MKTATLFKTGCICFMILGIGHLLAHFLLKIDDPAAAEVRSRMENFKIPLTVTRSLLQVHTGYSLMMGVLLFFYGFTTMLKGGDFGRDRKTDIRLLLTCVTVSALSLFMSVKYFFIPPQILALVALLSFGTAYLRYPRVAERGMA